MRKTAALFLFSLLLFGCGPERPVEGPPPAEKPAVVAPVAGECARAPAPPGELVELIHVTDGDTIYVWRFVPPASSRQKDFVPPASSRQKDFVPPASSRQKEKAGETPAVRKRERVRLLGVNAPELGTPAGEAAKAALAKKLSGKKIFLVFPCGEIRDKWGRLLAEVKAK